ncbi:MAG: hypothetical protein WD002_00395 [Pseudomonadales bacterium]
MKAKALVILLLALLGGCTTTVIVEGTVPTPLVAKIPLEVGVHFPEDFKSFQHEEVIEHTGTFKFSLGEQNLTFFRNLMAAMFDRVVEVGEPPLARAEAAGLDGVIVPEILKYGFLTPGISGLNFYSASIHYRITLYGANGDKVADWTLVGYGKAEGGAFGRGDALSEATLLAIRDAGARIAIEFPNQPGVDVWIKRRNIAGNSGGDQIEPVPSPVEG